jgi:two-component system, OmpR family, response regulator RegX3
VSSPTPRTTTTSDPATPIGARVLIVEDEPSLAESIEYTLEREGFRPTVAPDGTIAIERFRSDRPSLVLLDLMLPSLSGLDVCRIIRAESTVPIVILTAKGSEADKVAGLELGADDYVTKPFSMRELVSRVRAQLRRAGMGADDGEVELLTGGPVVMDVPRHEVRVSGQLVTLPPKEFELLEAFLLAKGRLLTRDFLIEDVWGADYYGDTRTLDVHVKRLRQKIEVDPHHPRHLVTVRGLGYRFVD